MTETAAPSPAPQMSAPSATPGARAVPQLSVRPVFDQGLAMVQAVIAGVVGTVVMTLAGGTLLYILIMLLGLGRLIPAGYVYGLVLVASIVLLPPLFFEMKKKACRQTVCHFYGDYADFQFFRFYLSRRRGRFQYADVQDVFQRANALQEQRALTTLYIYVPALAAQLGFGPRELPAVPVNDVPQRGDQMTRILGIIGQNRAAA